MGVAFLLAALGGCGYVRETLPERSAMEQMLISTAADRAIARIPSGSFAGRRVCLDISNLECYDKPYVIQRIKAAVLADDGYLTESREDADVVLEVASGGLSIDRCQYFFGLPAVALPIPMAGEPLRTPEIPLFKVIYYEGKAKLLFSAVDPESNGQLYELPVCYGQAESSLWWWLCTGPYGGGDLPEMPE